ncbi:glycoside hydrolase family 28 protein [Desarmillaria tabescens]|uniref:endo-polygalacturonase n=1 Tax=Armillaria tabescens TaxID=1929756 RepID=A0AA39K5P7_ARMTA|nr:glycoside hydrolase family 28 protein [Desarmillaria tabescens]KAK0452728.1 glycoside hydrolase family 28 protein [Desarmillaria tabescens]
MFQHAFRQFVFTAMVLTLMSAIPTGELEEHASCTISSVSSASSIWSCLSVTISAFTIPSRSTLMLSPKSGATITMAGDITFTKTSSDGPLFTIDGEEITFNGMGYSFDICHILLFSCFSVTIGVDKPHPLLKFKGSGTYSDFMVLNSPAQAISISNSDSLIFDSITVDNSDGDDDDLGHNTDVRNQDDCITINDGSNIMFKNNKCSGGHGISISSISSGKSVTDVIISGNTITDSMYGFRIKVKASATSADVNFTGSTTTIKVGDDARHLAIDCGACSGTWDFSKLKITGSSAGTVDSNDATISGRSY